MKRYMLVSTSLLVMLMVALAGICNNNALIFPEIAALAFGGWAASSRPWMADNLSLWLSPSLAAIIGTLIINYCPFSLPLQAGTAFLCVLVELWILRSAVLPSVSAAILPLVTKDSSWSYPCSVCLFMGIVALVCILLDKKGFGNYTRVTLRPVHIPIERQALASLWRWGKILLAVLAVAWISSQTGWRFLLAPPLIVACIEFVNPGGKLRSHPFRLMTLIFLSGLSGTLFIWIAWQGLLPFWLACGLATGTVFLLYQRTKMYCPPALALAVLPSIVPEQALLWYPLQLAGGCVLFFFLGSLLFSSRSVTC